MNDTERLNLKNLVNQSDCQDNTETIRKLKHSVRIRDEIRKVDTLRRANSTLEFSKLQELCQSECLFLFNNYTDIFNKLLVNELDLEIMTKLLIVLKMIEDGKLGQHEGSVAVGKILKELYVDSALKRADNLDKEHESEKTPFEEGKPISWKEYKMTLQD